MMETRFPSIYGARSSPAQVTGRNVGVGTDMLLQLGHEALAEPHDFCVALTVGIEVGAALTAAHRQGGQGVLEGLLEAQELHDGQVYVGCETDTALIGTDGGVELYAVAAVDLHLAGVVYPAYAEHNNALGLYHAIEHTGLNQVGTYISYGRKGFQHLSYSLEKLRLAGVACSGFSYNFARYSLRIFIIF